ncbi:lasso RiPP family leader peptide-containing protein [Pseudonocardia sp. TRM90224]|uniref:lasso RiPP family leader peptide-containing protein n=1 Tax=Pseudonocardia sp. TRM90224 TaxID=2812678 RepID=UPI001E566791|nr:lasso RiPP family leader peptide-containing protein [Pseudonocardia sp. TRM90224]
METTESYEQSSPVRETYEPPALVEVGGFTEMTMGACSRTPEGRPRLYYFDC